MHNTEAPPVPPVSGAPPEPESAVPTGPLVSVVIPTFNRGRVVERAIASALGQTYRPIEILVIDDGSTDDTEERVNRLVAANLTYYRTRVRTGSAAARDLGVRLASGEFVSFLDPDDEWLPGKTWAQVARFLAGPPGLVLVYCGVRQVSDPRPAADRSARGPAARPDARGRADLVGAPAAMIRRSLFDRAGPLDRALRAGAGSALRPGAAGRNLVDVVPEIGVLIRGRASHRPAGRTGARPATARTPGARHTAAGSHGAAPRQA